MRILLKLHGWLAGAGPSQTALEVPPGTTPMGVLDLLGIPAGACVFVRNGEQASYREELHEGDRLEIAHMASGG